MEPRPELELRAVRKTFGRTVAVDGIDLTVDRSEFVALLGPSGCGKTTTLRVVAGFEPPDAGEVLIRQRNITDLPPYRRDIGIVFQSYALFPHMTVFDNVAYGLRRRGVARAEIQRKVGAVLDMTQLQRFAGRYPRQLSGGQQQRVAVARAIVIQPSVLLLDEPLSNLDAKLREEMRGELRRLQQRLEIATIFVTHDQDEALSMATRVAVMHDGHIEQIGTPEEIYDRPRTRFVATFIGGCNFLEGRVVEAGGRTVRLAVGSLALTAAAPAGGTSTGVAGTLSVRPENARLLAYDQGAPVDANAVPGIIDEVTYLGASRQYRVGLNGGRQFLVYQQGTLSRAWLRGDRVLVVWEPEEASFYPDGTHG